MKLSIQGKIKSTQKKNSGIHGLKVEILDKDFLKNDYLGCTYTNSSGEYYFYHNVDKGLEQIFEGDLEIFIRIKDLNEKILHKSKVYKCPLNQVIKIDAKINATVINNAKLPKKGMSLSGGIISNEVYNTIERAFEYVSQPNDKNAIQTLNATFYCPLPPLHEFDNVLDVAKGVLEGNPREIIKFRELLQNFDVWKQPSSQNESEQLSMDEAKFLMSDDFLNGIKDQIEEQNFLKNNPSIIPRENTALLLMATMVVSGDNPITIHRNLGIINRQISGLKRVNRLYNEAKNVFLGNKNDGQHFLRTMKYFGGTWGPDDAPPRGPIGPWPNPEPDPFPWPPEPRPRPWPIPDCPEDLERWACTAEIVRAFREAMARRIFYSIDSVSPLRACPGETITISGSNFIFEGRTGNVVFQTESGTVSVSPESWTDSEITVIVPTDAICGTIALDMPGATIIACDTVFDLFRPARFTTTNFEGGKTVVRYLNITGLNRSDCIEPNERFGVSWKVCNATNIRLRITDDRGEVIVNEILGSETGANSYVIPDYNTTTSITASIEVNGCNNDSRSVTFFAQKAYELSIDGIEITQGIQYYQAANHLTDINDRGADNSLRLVTNKSAWVRVYLRSGQLDTFEGGSLPQVTGTLDLDRRVGGVWRNVNTLAPNNAPFTAVNSFPNYNAERGNINSSLNFIIPANQMTGFLRVRVNVNSPYVRCGNPRATDERIVDVNLQQTLQVAGVMIRYTGVDAAGNPLPTPIPAPNLANLQATAAQTLLMFPVSSNANFRISATINLNVPLNDPATCAGCCSNNWVTLNRLVRQARNNDMNRAGWLFYGLLPNGVPNGPIIGCESSGVSSGFIGDPTVIGNPAIVLQNQITMAHELGHRVGLAHSPCGNVGTTNAAPAYEPYDPANTPAGSIGEYGLNINNGTIFNPATNFDFMSYCGPSWISIFSHNFLINPAGLNPLNISTGLTSSSAMTFPNNLNNEVQNLIIVQGQVKSEKEIEVINLVRVDTFYPKENGIKTGYVIELVNENDSVISSNHIERLVNTSHQGDCGCNNVKKGEPEFPFEFRAILQNVAQGGCIRIRKNDEIIWQKDCPEKPTIINQVSATCKSDKLKIRWKYSHKNVKNPDVWIRWSNDNGKTWNGLTVGLTGTSAELDLGTIPSGEVIFKVLAHDGYDTSKIVSKPLEVPNRKAVVKILHPQNNDIFNSSVPLHLWAACSSLSQNDIEENNITWYIGKKEVGKGRDIWVHGLRKGKHSITIKVKSDAGISDDKINVVIK